jgi:aminoglycoside phosphotransferase
MPKEASLTGTATAINATWPRVHATLAAIAVLKRLRPRLSSVLFLTPNICVKYGPFQHISEAATMQYIAANTNMPVPKVYCVFERKGVTYIVMSRIAGSPLGHRWEQRSAESKERILKQLKGYVSEMRSLRPADEGGVQAVDGGKLYDVRLSGGVYGFGPFRSVQDFHSFLRDGIGSSPGQHPEVNELVDKHTTAHYGISFTHGDLNSMNILTKGDDVVGIVDWDTAGWFPEYWEYTTAINVNPFNQFWKTEIAKFVDVYSDAAHMERLRQQHFGAF